MTGRDGDEPDRRVEPDEAAAAREDIDAAFEEIVAAWRAEDTAPRWPGTAPPPERTAGDPTPPGSLGTQPVAPPPVASRPTAAETTSAPREPEEHFVPPEPPPLPKIRRRTLGGLALLGLGLLLVVVPDLIGLSYQLGLLAGLIALTSGVGWLVLGLREGPPHDSGWDDGAVL